MTVILQRTVDIGMVCNGLIAGLVAITAPSGYVENWAAPLIGVIGGMIVVPAILAIDKKLDDPVGVLSAHGLAGVWGTIACGLFTAPRLAEYNAIGKADGGLFYSGCSAAGPPGPGSGRRVRDGADPQLHHVLAISKTIGLRVTAEEEMAGLDISEHGMYGYPEQHPGRGALRLPAPDSIKLNGHAPTPAGSAGAARAYEGQQSSSDDTCGRRWTGRRPPGHTASPARRRAPPWSRWLRGGGPSARCSGVGHGGRAARRVTPGRGPRQRGRRRR